MSEHPDTIYNPEAFDRSLPSGFDGIFDWSWTKGCFGQTKIKPMDFDGVVERKLHYLVFETKKPGIAIPKGQEIALNNLHRAKSFCVIRVWGKKIVEEWFVAWGHINKQIYERKGYGVLALQEFIKEWYRWADR